MGLSFFLNSILLGAGLAMDAFSVSCANGLREPNMKAGRMVKIAGVYAFFQFAMPMAGWFVFISCLPSSAPFSHLSRGSRLGYWAGSEERC